MSVASPRAEQRYVVLDGLRGLAAIAVASGHISERLLPGSYIMVDFFFILSGFVLAAKYDTAFAQQAQPFTFLALRIRRLWPLYSLGWVLTASFALLYGADSLPGAHGHSPGWLWATVTSEFLGIPAPHTLPFGRLYPLNFPAWSLFFELLANFAYAALGPALTGRRPWIVVAGAFIGLAAASLVHGSLDTGVTWAQFWWGVDRVMFGFFLGVALHRAFVARAERARPASGLYVAAVAVALLATVVAFPVTGVGDIVKAAILMPAIVWFGAHLRPGDARMTKACALLGLLSYPLYVTHIGVVMWMSAAAHTSGLQISRPYLALTLGIALAIAWAATRYYEPGVARVLRVGRQGLNQGAQ